MPVPRKEEWSRGVMRFKIKCKFYGIRETQEYQVRATVETTISEFIQHIAASHGVSPNGKLFYCGVCLSNPSDKHTTLEEHGVHDESLMEFVSYKAPKRLQHPILVSIPGGHKIQLRVLNTTTLQELKHKIQDEIGMPHDEQVLLHKGKPQKSTTRTVELYTLGKEGITLKWQCKDDDTLNATKQLIRYSRQQRDGPSHCETHEISGTPDQPAHLRQRQMPVLIGHLKNRNSEEILQSLPPVSISHDGLLEISQEIVHWRRLAQRLGLTPAKIVEIRENNKSDYLEQKLQMLQQWKRANGRLATWRALVCAVIEENDYELVDKIVTISRVRKMSESNGDLRHEE